MRLTLDLGTIRAEWCDGCMTSAIAVCDITSLSESGVTTVGRYRKCQRCQNPSTTKGEKS